MKGRYREYTIKKMLEKEGWYVIRSAKSGSAFDLVAFHPNYSYARLIQVKAFPMSENAILKVLKEMPNTGSITVREVFSVVKGAKIIGWARISSNGKGLLTFRGETKEIDINKDDNQESNNQ